MTAQLSQKQIPGRFNYTFILLIILVLAVCSVVYSAGGILHHESALYLPQYLRERPLLNKLYDSNIFDLGNYQARELSYFFDYIDSKFIACCIQRGYPHFLSLTHYLFSILISLLIWRYCVKDLHLGLLVGVGLVVLFWTSPSVFFSNYFRSSKIGVSLAITLIFLLLYRILLKNHKNPGFRITYPRLAMFFSLAVSAMLFDRQGFFLILVTIVFLTVWVINFPSKNIFKLILALSSSVGFGLTYNYLIAPFLTLHFNHYWPDFSYQQMNLDFFITLPMLFGQGIRLLIDTLRFLIGDIPYEVTAITIVLILTAVLVWSRRARTKGQDVLPLSVAVAGLLVSYMLICVLIAMMLLKHPAIILPDVRRLYYCLPIVSILCMTIALILSEFINRWQISRWIVLIFIFSAAVGNIYAIPRHRNIILNGHLKAYRAVSTGLIEALKNIKNPHYEPPSRIRSIFIYQYFKEYITVGSGSAKRTILNR